MISTFRHLAADKKNGMHILVTKVARSIGIFEKDEVFNSKTLKTKMIFVVAQVIFTLVTIIPTPFLYSSYNLSCIYICIIFGVCIWRGGSYYIEVFSERYKLKFVENEEKAENVTSVDGKLEVDHELFHQIADAINEANETVCMSEVIDNEKDINSFENKNTERENDKSSSEESDNDKSSSEESDNGPDSDKSWEEIYTNL